MTDHMEETLARLRSPHSSASVARFERLFCVWSRKKAIVHLSLFNSVYSPAPFGVYFLEVKMSFFFREKKKEEGHLYLAGNHYLADVRLSDEDALVLCKSLAANKYIVSLDLRYNHITDEGCRNIQAFLEVAATAPI